MKRNSYKDHWVIRIVQRGGQWVGVAYADGRQIDVVASGDSAKEVRDLTTRQRSIVRHK